MQIIGDPLNDAGRKQFEGLLRRAGLSQMALVTTPGDKGVLALGDSGLRQSLGLTGILRARGWPEWSHSLGKWVVPTLHPLMLLPRRGKHEGRKKQKKFSPFVRVVVEDLRKAFRISQEGFTKLPVDYLLDPSPDRAMDFAAQVEREGEFLCQDIETAGKVNARNETEIKDTGGQIIRINYAFRPRFAMTIPFEPRYDHVHRRLLESQIPKISWFGKGFDQPVLKMHGYYLGGEHFDAMDWWHVFQPRLDKNLEFVTSMSPCVQWMSPWKHLNKSNLPFYGCCDADSNISIWFWLREEMHKIRIAA